MNARMNFLSLMILFYAARGFHLTPDPSPTGEGRSSLLLKEKGLVVR
jgi:hypothetical protein